MGAAAYNMPITMLIPIAAILSTFIYARVERWVSGFTVIKRVLVRRVKR